jgi:hypothetical protein
MTRTVVKLVNVGRTGCLLFLTAVGRLETEDDMCLCTFTPFLAATLQTDFKIPKEVQFEGRFI